MKKLLAILLALMLPCCALADIETATWTMEVTADGLAELFSAIKPYIDYGFLLPTSSEMLGDAAEMLSGFSVTVQADDAGASHISFDFGDRNCFTIDTAIVDETEYLVSSLLPGLLCVSPYDTEPQELAALASIALDNMNWGAVWAALDECFADWEQTLDMTVEYGYFAGDAYMGSGCCMTFRFDERDLSTLLEALSRAEWPEELSVLARYVERLYWSGETSMGDAFHASIQDAAFSNPYHYVLRLVDSGDDDASAIGLSLLTYDGDQLVSTLSMGFYDGRLEAVLGYGLRDENFYLAMTFDFAPDAPLLSARLYRDPYKEGYAVVSSDSKDRYLELNATLTGESDDTSDSLRLEMWGPAIGDSPLALVLKAAQADADASLALSLMRDDTLLCKTAITVRIDDSVDHLPPLETDGLQTVQYPGHSEEEDRLVDEAIENSLTDIFTNLILGF